MGVGASLGWKRIATGWVPPLPPLWSQRGGVLGALHTGLDLLCWQVERCVEMWGEDGMGWEGMHGGVLGGGGWCVRDGGSFWDDGDSGGCCWVLVDGCALCNGGGRWVRGSTGPLSLGGWGCTCTPHGMAFRSLEDSNGTRWAREGKQI